MHVHVFIAFLRKFFCNYRVSSWWLFLKKISFSSDIGVLGHTCHISGDFLTLDGTMGNAKEQFLHHMSSTVFLDVIINDNTGMVIILLPEKNLYQGTIDGHVSHQNYDMHAWQIVIAVKSVLKYTKQVWSGCISITIFIYEWKPRTWAFWVYLHMKGSFLFIVFCRWVIAMKLYCIQM